MNRRRRFAPRLAAVVLLALLAPGCATTPLIGASCPAGFNQTRTVEMFFGRNIPSGGQVSDSDWSDFVAKEVTPRFPAGFTVMEANGQWRGDNGETVQEPSKVIVLILSDAKKDAPMIAAIRDAYVKRFQQEAVLVVERPACAGF